MYSTACHLCSSAWLCIRLCASAVEQKSDEIDLLPGKGWRWFLSFFFFSSLLSLFCSAADNAMHIFQWRHSSSVKESWLGEHLNRSCTGSRSFSCVIDMGLSQAISPFPFTSLPSSSGKEMVFYAWFTTTFRGLLLEAWHAICYGSPLYLVSSAPWATTNESPHLYPLQVCHSGLFYMPTLGSDIHHCAYLFLPHCAPSASCS